MADDPVLSPVPEFDPLTAPLTMPREVRRVDESGLPTTSQLDWEQAFKNWTVKQTVSLNTKITTVRDEAEAGFAEVHDDISAIVDEQGAMASQITTLNANFNGVSANGQVKFQVMATPAGAAAAYGIYLTAGNSFTGLQMIAYSGGGSAISFNASQFMLNDSGTAQNVFNYAGGIFTFNVPVRVRTGDILDGAVSSTVAASGNPSASVTVNDVTAGARVRVMAIYEGDTTPRNSIALFTVRLYQDGSLVKTVPLSVASSGSGTSAVTSYLNTTMGYVATLAAGNHTFSVDCVVAVGLDPGISKNFYIEATVLKR